MFDFVTDDGTEVGVGFLLPFPVADAAQGEVGAVTDGAFVVIRSADEAVILIFCFHG